MKSLVEQYGLFLANFANVCRQVLPKYKFINKDLWVFKNIYIYILAGWSQIPSFGSATCPEINKSSKKQPSDNLDFRTYHVLKLLVLVSFNKEFFFLNCLNIIFWLDLLGPKNLSCVGQRKLWLYQKWHISVAQ